MVRPDGSQSEYKVTYTYRYDETGSRIFAKKAKTFPYSYLESWQNTYNDDNQMVAATVCEGNLTKKYTFTYDANGNLPHECFGKQAEVVYQYDMENRLTAVYDQQKLLMASTYDGDGNRAFQLNYNPEAVCGYGIGWGDKIYMPEHSQNEDGSLTANTWYNGMVTDVYQYDPYGQVTLGSTEYTDFYGYNAESYNPNTGLEYLRARYYNAKQGRFFQEDTYLGEITDSLTLNRYAYVKNSPLNYIDPSGNSLWGFDYVTGKDDIDSLELYLPSMEEVLRNYTGDLSTGETPSWITSGINYIKRKIEESKESGMLKDCLIYRRGIEFGMNDFWNQLDHLVLGQTFHAIGWDKFYYSEEEYREAYADALNNLTQTSHIVISYAP